MIPLHYAVLKNDLPMVAWLIRFKAEDTALRGIRAQQVPGSGDRGQRKLSRGKSSSNELVTPTKQAEGRRNSSFKGTRQNQKASAEE